MDIKEYISSGILENYVLGSVSDQERQEVECMSHIYPEIKAELEALQQTMERVAQAGAVSPPGQIKAKVMAEIDSVNQEAGLTVAHKEESATTAAASEQAKTSNKTYLYVAAASILLLVFTGYGWLQESGNSTQLAEDLETLQDANQTLNDENGVLGGQLAELETQLIEGNRINNILTDKYTQTVVMSGTDNSPGSVATVYWNVTSQEVLFKADNLQEIPEDKSFQLWAIVDGTPQDMGTFELDGANNQVIAMPYKVGEAQAFAITIEEKGGSAAPTLSTMQVIGNV